VVILNLFLSEGRILIDADFGINAVNVFVRSYCPRIYLYLSSVDRQKHFVQLLQLLDALTVRLAFKAEISADFSCLFGRQAFFKTEA